MHGMIDVVIAAVIVLFAVLGWKRGLFRSLAELAAVLLALVLAVQIANIAAPAVVDTFLRPAAYEAIEAQLEELEAGSGLDGNPYEGARELLEAIPNQFLRESAQALLEGDSFKAAVWVWAGRRWTRCWTAWSAVWSTRLCAARCLWCSPSCCALWCVPWRW